MIRKLTYSVQELMPYVNWVYFYHAWGLSGKPEAERLAMKSEAEKLCRTVGRDIHVRALFGLFASDSTSPASAQLQPEPLGSPAQENAQGL